MGDNKEETISLSSSSSSSSSSTRQTAERLGRNYGRFRCLVLPFLAVLALIGCASVPKSHATRSEPSPVRSRGAKRSPSFASSTSRNLYIDGDETDQYNKLQCSFQFRNVTSAMDQQDKTFFCEEFLRLFNKAFETDPYEFYLIANLCNVKDQELMEYDDDQDEGASNRQHRKLGKRKKNTSTVDAYGDCLSCPAEDLLATENLNDRFLQEQKKRYPSSDGTTRLPQEELETIRSTQLTVLCRNLLTELRLHETPAFASMVSMRIECERSVGKAYCNINGATNLFHRGS